MVNRHSRHFTTHLYLSSLTSLESPCLYFYFHLATAAPCSSFALLSISSSGSAACQGTQHWQVFWILADGEYNIPSEK